MENKINRRRISILFLIDQIWSEKGGTEQHLWWLLKKLPRDFYNINLIVFSDVRNCDPNLIPVKPFIMGRKYGLGWCSFLSRFIALVFYIIKHKIDIVHAFTPNDELVAVWACFFARRGKVCSHRRNIGYSLTFYKKLKSFITQVFNIKYIANSNAAQISATKNERIGFNKIEIIKNPLSQERAIDGFKNPISLSSLGIPNNSPIVGIVATVRPVKGYEVFLKASKKVLDLVPGAYFLCIGEQDHDYFNSLRILEKNLDLNGRVIWYGGLDNPYRILQMVTVAVLSSHSESLSNAVLEYANAERAIVSTDVGGMSEIIINNETGFLVPSNQPELLAERIVTLLNDHEKRMVFGVNAKRLVMNCCSEGKILNQYNKFYKNLYIQLKK